MFNVQLENISELHTYLIDKNWLLADEKINQVSIPGAGNMNFVIRVKTNVRSFILKQSRDYVEKYPQIPAPDTRVLTEAAFYKKIETSEILQEKMPKILGIDTENNILIIEDLGDAIDYSFLYKLKDKITFKEVAVLTNYLSNLHTTFQKTKLDDELENLEMRQLNYEHIFHYPFLEDNGFDLDTIQTGLQNVALHYKKDTILKDKIKPLAALYLSKGKYLLHGDFYPGSWLKTTNGIKIIDPEFCFYGLREFDVAVFIAHLYLTKHDEQLIEEIKNNYTSFEELNTTILNGFVGIEIMRRLIGLAQLPFENMDLKSKENLLNFAYKLITNE
jgi:5-methylthioribose kinase